MGVSTVIAGVGAAAAVAGGIGSAVSSSKGAKAQQQGGQAESDAANQAALLQEQIYKETVAREQPWVTAGTGAINTLSGLLVPDSSGKFATDPTNALRATPGYQWDVSQGVNAMDLSAAKQGLLLSGAQQKGLQAFGTGLADQTYQNYLTNLFGVSGAGQNAVTGANAAGTNYASQVTQNNQTLAQAQAQNATNQYNAKQSGYNSIGSLIGMGAGILAAPFTGGTSLIGSGISALSGLANMGGGGGGGGSSLYGVSNAYNPGQSFP